MHVLLERKVSFLTLVLRKKNKIGLLIEFVKEERQIFCMKGVFRAGVKCKWVYKIQTYINIHTLIYLYMYSLDIQCLGCIIALSL